MVEQIFWIANFQAPSEAVLTLLNLRVQAKVAEREMNN